MQMRIDFMDAIFGKTETITLEVDEQCKHCNGTGAETPSDVTTCPTCHGTGYVMTQQRSPFGVIQQQSVCPDCRGTGKKITRTCHQCNGRGYEHRRVKLDVKIPQGIQSGQQIRIAGKGERGVNGGPNGDLYIEITVKPHSTFTRQGDDIYISVPVSAIDATIGTTIQVPTVYGDVELKIPEGTQPNTKFRLKGKGVKNRRGYQGDEYVEVQVEIPKRVSKKDRELYEKLRNSQSDSPFERFKNAFK
jgi:molecular chaperone DnaJ